MRRSVGISRMDRRVNEAGGLPVRGPPPVAWSVRIGTIGTYAGRTLIM
ncbi:hypothetical protein [Burkholderia ubonensis]|nr:hypothetical protein [Burkholderia ubonensis]